jgi:hypothetical protein
VDWLVAFLASPAGIAAKALLVGTILTFALGLFAAIRDGTFSAKYVGEFVKDPLALKVGPVTVALLVGYIAGDAVILGPAIIAAGAVAAEMIAKAMKSIGQLRMTPGASAASNPLPGTPPGA